MGFDGGTTQYANWCAIERRKKKEDAYVTILLIGNISPTGYCGKANHCISCIT